jgi:hypothetical protein
MNTTKEQRAVMLREAEMYGEVVLTKEQFAALLADAERAERYEEALRAIVGDIELARGTNHLERIVLRTAKAATGETT